jgi:hypothetical protein
MQCGSRRCNQTRDVPDVEAHGVKAGGIQKRILEDGLPLLFTLRTFALQLVQ